MGYKVASIAGFFVIDGDSPKKQCTLPDCYHRLNMKISLEEMTVTDHLTLTMP
jgi:hypothetical protein